MMTNEKSPYLPKVRTGYHPTSSAVDTTNGTDKDIHLPNPAVDSIVVNNIACSEFDYTQDMTMNDVFDSNSTE